MFCGNLDGLVEIGTLEKVKAADPFPCLGERTLGDQYLPLVSLRSITKPSSLTIMQAAFSSVNCGLNPKPSLEKKFFDLCRSRTARLTKIFRESVDAMSCSLVG